MANMYSSPNSSTIPGQQVDNTQQSMTNMALTGVSSGQVAPMVTDASQQLAEMQTPQQRSAYVASSDIPAMQANYDEMARKLYEYDKMHLAPMYANAPEAPSDALSFGRVGQSELQQLTPESAAGPTTLYADNPKYAMASQATQQNSVLDALNLLNTAIGKEFTATRGKYASTVGSQEGIVKTLLALFQSATDKEERAKDRASAAADRAFSRSQASQDKNIQEFNRRATEIKNKFLTGMYSTGDPQEAWGQAWKAIKVMRDNLGLQDLVTNEDIDDTLGGSYNSATGEAFGLATKENLRDIYLKGKPTSQQNAVLPLESSIANIKSARENYKKAWTDRGVLNNPIVSTALGKIPGVGEWISSTLNDAAYNYVKDINGVIASQVAKGIGGEVGNLATKDVERAQNELANLGSDPVVGQKRMDKAVMHATQGLMRLTKDKIIAINPTTREKVEVDTAEELEQVFNGGYTLIQ